MRVVLWNQFDVVENMWGHVLKHGNVDMDVHIFVDIIENMLTL